MPYTLEQKRKKNREAQKKFYNTEKGKKYAIEKYKKWAKKKRAEDPNYFKKYQKNRSEYYKKYRANYFLKDPSKIRSLNRQGAKKFYEKTKKNPKYILIRALRSRLGSVFSSIKKQQKPSTNRLLGCSLEELIVFIEKKFKKNMSWENYGKWHVDHIKPISKFDLTDKEEQKKCFHYTNLQPLWAVDNLKKGSKLIL